LEIRQRQKGVHREIILLIPIPRILPALTALTVTLLTPQALTARIPTVHTVRPVRRPLTAVIVQPLTAALIIQPLALKPAERGTALTAKCRNRQAPPLIAAPLTAVMTHHLHALKPEEPGMEAFARCRTRAVQVALPRTPPPPAGYSGK